MIIVFLKRLIDIIISFFFLTLLSPIICLIFILIKYETTGPAIIIQTRLGKNLKKFKMYKFRSLIYDKKQINKNTIIKRNHKSITKVGKFLRESSLDELPQLFNVFYGNMSLVGPRPPMIDEMKVVKKYDRYLERFSVMPGITGYAQVVGRNTLQWKNKIRYDLIYIKLIKKYGILIDFYVIIVTLFKVVLRIGIYEKN